MKSPTFIAAAALTLALAALGVLAATVSAQDTASSGSSNYKIGVVNRKAVFDAYQKNKDEFGKLEKEVEVLDGELQSKQDSIEKRTEDYKARKDSISVAEQTKLEEDLSSEMTAWKAEYQKLQTDIDRKSSVLMKSLREEIDAAVQQLGVSEDFHVILEGDPKVAGVLYFSTTLDITQKVTDTLNTAYRGGGAAAAKPAKRN